MFDDIDIKNLEFKVLPTNLFNKYPTKFGDMSCIRCQNADVQPGWLMIGAVQQDTKEVKFVILCPECTKLDAEALGINIEEYEQAVMIA